MKIKQKAREWWTDHYDDAISGALVFLLVLAAFAVGVIMGGKLFEDAQIRINCPSSFWEKN